jgi:nicotinate dehydrogenase subunit B
MRTTAGLLCQIAGCTDAAGHQRPPSIEIVLIDRPEMPSSGASEMAVGPLPAAIGNAVFDATGVRLRRVPFTPERVRVALANGPGPAKAAL